MPNRSSSLIKMATRARMVEMNRVSTSIEVMTRTSLSYPAASFPVAIHQHASGHLRQLFVIVEVRHFLAHRFEDSATSRTVKFNELLSFLIAASSNELMNVGMDFQANNE